MACDNPICTNEGTFEGDCPGSDDESHHCVDCGQLWCSSKGLWCEKCGEYWCPDWQHTFISLGSCERYGEFNDTQICSKCFLGDKKMWCKNDHCDCNLKHQVISEEWKYWNEHEKK